MWRFAKIEQDTCIVLSSTDRKTCLQINYFYRIENKK